MTCCWKVLWARGAGCACACACTLVWGMTGCAAVCRPCLQPAQAEALSATSQGVGLGSGTALL